MRRMPRRTLPKRILGHGCGGMCILSCYLMTVPASQSLMAEYGLQREEASGFSRDGDILFGGIFPVHTEVVQKEVTFREEPEEATCQKFGFQNYQWIQAMVFAVEEINNNPTLLPNITLGFQTYDSCAMLQRALKGSFWILTGQEKLIPNYICKQGLPPVVIIGESGSTRSILMARVLGLYRYPQVSYFSSSPLLSDRYQFPSFFRTIPSDDFQSRGLAQLVMHFGWTWVGILAVDDDYGQQGSSIVQQELLKAGACVAFSESILRNRADKNTIHIVEVIKASTAQAIIVFSFNAYLVPLFDEIVRQNVTQKIWIASEAWSTSSLLSINKYSKILHGTIGFAINSGDMSGFQNHFISISPLSSPVDPFLRRFWEEAFGCQWLTQEPFLKSKDNATKICTGDEKLDSLPINSMMDFRITYNIYNAVYAAALALKDLQMCLQGRGPFHHGACANLSEFHPWQLHHYIKNVRLHRDDTESFFDGHGNPPARYDIVNWQQVPGSNMVQVKVGSYDSLASSGKTLFINASAIQWATGNRQLHHYIKNVRLHRDDTESFFDGHGNPPARYDIVNWQQVPGSNMVQVKVGSYDSLASSGKTLFINASAIQWATGNRQVPTSVCSPSCPAGFRKATSPGLPSCCFHCLPCLMGEMSNQTDSGECITCPWDQWPSQKQNQCFPKITDFLSYNKSFGMALATSSIFSSAIPAVVLGIFIHYKSTAIVKASNLNLSCILLMSLTLCFLSSLAFIGFPTAGKCLLRQAAFGITFALCISCILAKTVMVVIAFNVTKPNSDLRRWVGPKLSYTVISVCTLIQVVLCAFWLGFAPPFSEFNTQVLPGMIAVECNEGSPIAFWCMLGYLGLLASICFVVAFLARKLPDSFNEAQFITFSMLAFLSVWISFTPAYLSTRGKYMVAMEIFAILSSSLALVSFIFFPKCYIILLRPKRNSKHYIMGKGASHSKKV